MAVDLMSSLFKYPGQTVLVKIFKSNHGSDLQILQIERNFQSRSFSSPFFPLS